MLFSKKIVNASLAAVLLSLGANAMDQGQAQQDISQKCELPSLQPPCQAGISLRAQRLVHQATLSWDNTTTITATTRKSCDLAFTQAARQKGNYRAGKTPLVDKPCFNEADQSAQNGQFGQSAQNKCHSTPEITAVATIPGQVSGSLGVEGTLTGTANFEELVVETLTRTNGDGTFANYLPNGPKTIGADQFFGSLAPEWANMGDWNTDLVRSLSTEIISRLTGVGSRVNWQWEQDSDGAVQVKVSDDQEPCNVVTIAPQAPAAQGKKGPVVVSRKH